MRDVPRERRRALIIYIYSPRCSLLKVVVRLLFPSITTTTSATLTATSPRAWREQSLLHIFLMLYSRNRGIIKISGKTEKMRESQSTTDELKAQISELQETVTFYECFIFPRSRFSMQLNTIWPKIITDTDRKYNRKPSDCNTLQTLQFYIKSKTIGP